MTYQVALARLFLLQLWRLFAHLLLLLLHHLHLLIILLLFLDLRLHMLGTVQRAIYAISGIYVRDGADAFWINGVTCRDQRIR